MTVAKTLEHSAKQEHFHILRSFVDTDELAANIVKEALSCHLQSCECKDMSWNEIAEAGTSFKLELGIPCGGDLTERLPLAASIARRAFQKAAEQFDTSSSLKTITNECSRLTGLSLLYGTRASMPSHYDSPTQPGQREEWLVMISIGNTAMFRCNKQVLTVSSGDVLVMDSMAVLHGVEGIVEDDPSNVYVKVGLPIPSRLGVLFWQAKGDVTKHTDLEQDLKDVNLGGLFNDSDDSDDD